MYSILVPNRYLVYLHPAEYARLEGILPIVREQTVRGLVEEVEKLNRPSVLQRYAGRVLRKPQIPVESATGGWHVEFLEDPDGEVPEGRVRRRLGAPVAAERRSWALAIGRGESRPSTSASASAPENRR